jgi:hypothetical protein
MCVKDSLEDRARESRAVAASKPGTEPAAKLGQQQKSATAPVPKVRTDLAGAAMVNHMNRSDR